MPTWSHAFALLVLSSLFACGPERDTTGKTGTELQPNLAPVSEPSGRGPCADDPRIGRVGFPGTPPVLIRRVEPIVRLGPGVRGIVIVEAIIDAQGVPCSVTVLRSLGRDADEAAVNAVKQWRFVPATLNGEGWPVAYTVTVTVGE